MLSHQPLSPARQDLAHGRTLPPEGPQAAASACGFALWLCDRLHLAPTSLTLAIGRDGSPGTEAIQTEVGAALAGLGCRVLDGRTLPVGALRTAVSHPKISCQGALWMGGEGGGMPRPLIRQGWLGGESLEAIRRIAVSYRPEGDFAGTVMPFDLSDWYAGTLSDRFRRESGLPRLAYQPLGGVRICLEGGTPALPLLADRVLRPLGASVTVTSGIPFDASPAGLRDGVIRTGARAGLRLAADGSRAWGIDGEGHPLTAARLLPLLAAREPGRRQGGDVVLLGRGMPEEAVPLLERRGYTVRRTEGELAAEARKLLRAGIRCGLAIEETGRVLFGEVGFFEDGLLFAVKLLARLIRCALEGYPLPPAEGDGQGEREPEAPAIPPALAPSAVLCWYPEAEDTAASIQPESVGPEALSSEEPPACQLDPPPAEEPPACQLNPPSAAETMVAEPEPPSEREGDLGDGTPDPAPLSESESDGAAAEPVAAAAPTGMAPEERIPLRFTLPLTAEDPAGYLDRLMEGLTGCGAQRSEDGCRLMWAGKEGAIGLTLMSDPTAHTLRLAIEAETDADRRMAVRRVLALLDGYHRIDGAPLRGWLVHRGH